MKAVVFSGTTEGRRFSKKLAELGVAVTVCVATPLGAEEQGEMAGITVHAGRLQPDAMAALLAGADLCVDATHPYAVDATRNIRAAAVQAGVEYRRLLRAQSPLPPGCAVFETAAQAAEYLAGTEGNILLATGAKELAVFAGLEPARLYPRVLPTPEGIAACEAANVPHRNIIAMQGPFSLALNKALITQFQIRYLVTKDGGAAGGFAEKVQAAADTGAQLVVLRRPPETGETETQILAYCKEALSAQAQQAVRSAGLVFGAKRLLAGLPADCTARQFALYQPADILETLAQNPGQDAVVLYSGDTGFYSGASGLLTPLRALGIPARVYPGVSSIQLLSAALGRPWQDWKLVSAHGCACDPVAECMMNRSVFFLTGGTETPASLCQKLTDAGMGEAHGVVGENLGTEAEAIRYGSAAELAGQSFAPLSVLLVENFDLPQLRAPGFPDESFIRSEVPMTKQEVRAAALAKLAVMPTDTLWDVGAGTGSVSVELALAAPKGRVYAVECEPDACELIRKNRAKFHACNLILIEGRAPDVLADLPAPDAVFIGGTKGGMEAVLDEVLGKNPNARICISAIALETLGAAIAALTARGLTAEVTQIAVSRTKPAGRLHLLMANNPIFLITGTRK